MVAGVGGCCLVVSNGRFWNKGDKLLDARRIDEKAMGTLMLKSEFAQTNCSRKSCEFRKRFYPVA